MSTPLSAYNAVTKLINMHNSGQYISIELLQQTRDELVKGGHPTPHYNEAVATLNALINLRLKEEAEQKVAASG